MWDTAAGVDAVRQARGARADRAAAGRGARLRAALAGPADPAVELPQLPTPTPVEPIGTPGPAPVDPDDPVVAPWGRSVLTAVSAPAMGTVAAVVAWHATFAADAGPLYELATWQGLTGLPQAGAVVVAAALAGTVSAGVSTVFETWSERTAAAARELRAAALKVHEAVRADARREVELGRARAVRNGLLDAVRQAEAGQLARALDGERRAEATVPRRPAGLLPRLVGWMQTQTTAVADAVLDSTRPGDPAHRAALSRLAAGLRGTPRRDAPGRVSRLVLAARAAGVGPGDVPDSPELDRVLELDAEPDPAGSPDAARGRPPGIDWAHVARIANGLGWWPEEDVPLAGPAPSRGPASVLPSSPPVDSQDPGTPDAPAPDGPAPEAPVGSAPGVPGAPDPAPGAPDPAPGTPERAPDPTRVPGGPAGALPPPFPYASPSDRTAAPAPAHPPAPAQPPVPPSTPGSAGPDAGVLVEDWSGGTGRTLAALVDVTSPGGQVLTLLARWIEPGPGRRPVLVLTQLPGEPFWWGVAAAVQLAVGSALARLLPGVTGDRLRGAVLLAERPGRPGVPDLAQIPALVGDDGVLRPTGGPAPLPSGEAQTAARLLRLTSSAELAGRLRAAPVR